MLQPTFKRLLVQVDASYTSSLTVILWVSLLFEMKSLCMFVSRLNQSSLERSIVFCFTAGRTCLCLKPSAWLSGGTLQGQVWVCVSSCRWVVATNGFEWTAMRVINKVKVTTTGTSVGRMSYSFKKNFVASVLTTLCKDRQRQKSHFYSTSDTGRAGSLIWNPFHWLPLICFNLH